MKRRVFSLFLAIMLCLSLLPAAAFAEGTTGGGVYVPPGSTTEGGGRYEDTRTEIWRDTTLWTGISRPYDGTTDGSTIPITLTFTDGANSFELKEGTGFTAVKTFDSADAGDHTVTVEITLIGEAAKQYKLKAGAEKFEIGGTINPASPDLTVSLSKTTCAVGEKLLPLLSVESAPKDAAVTYYYTTAAFKKWAGSSGVQGSEVMPKIDENTAIDKLDEEGNNTYYVYARTAATQNYQEGMSNVLEFTVAEKVDPVASVTRANGPETTYGSFSDAWTAAIADNGSTLKLLADATLPNGNTDLGQSLTLDLNGYVLGSNGSLTVKNGAALTVRNAGAENSETPVKVGLYLNLLVEKGGSFTCTDGGLRYLGLLSAGTGDYAIQLAEGESHCTFGGFAQRDESATVGDLLKATPGMALHADHNGSDVRIERSTRINSGFTYFSFYVGPCSEHQMDANGTCIYCGASYAASVRAGGGVTTNYTSLDDALDAMKDGDTVTLLSNAEITKWHFLSKAFTLELNGKTATTQSNAELYLHARVIVQDSSTGKTGGMAGTALLNVQEDGDLIIQSGTFDGKITINDGKLTINGGTFNQEVALPRGNSDSVFFSGGTFAKIWYPNSSGSFLDLLADGYAFYDKNGKLVNAAKITDTNLYNVHIGTHAHSFTGGACACGYTCPHTSVNADGKCTVCNKQFAASITEGKNVTYYDTFNGALVYAYWNDGCTLKLLADVTEAAVMINNPFLFDLNGHNVGALSVDARATIKDSGTEKGKIGKVTVSNEKVPGLTLGDLLEEGYAFQYDTGYWANDSHLQTSDGHSVTVEKAPIQSVAVYAKDKNHKEVSTIAYGTTGAVTLVSSCRMGEMSGADLSYLWYKLGGFAATAPLEGATGANYTLPDNLTAGTHTYLLICTSDGYSKSAEITITVTPVSLAGAEVTVQNPTYNGKPQEPKVTVKLGDKTLSRDNDYTMQVTKQTDAGSYKLTIKGGGNYTDEIKNVEWKIEPIKIDHVEVSSDISKTYDGTAAVTKTAEEWATALRFKTLSAYDVVSVPSDAYTISDVCFVTKNAAGAYVASPEVGEKNIQFTVTFQNNNYVLQTALDDQPASSKTYIQSGLATFTITKAAAPALTTEMMLYVTNDLAKTYEVDLNALLPELTKPRAYGALRYTVNADGLNRDYYTSGAAVENDKLMLPIHDVNTDQTGSIGNVVVTVASDNYQDITLTIPVFAQNKLPPDAADVTVSASDITYGQTVADSKLTVTGAMKCPRTKKEIKGTFAWTAPETKPDAAGDYTAEWTFTPAEGYEEYAETTGRQIIKVNHRSVKITGITAADKVYDGTTDVTLDCSKAVLDGKLEGDDLTVSADGVFAKAEVIRDDARVVNLSNLKLGGKDKDNYVVDDIYSQTRTSAKITPATLTLTPDAGQSKVFGSADSTLTYTVSGAVNGETPAFTGALERAEGETVGSYAITRGSLALKSDGSFKANNYDLKLSDTIVNFTITKAAAPVLEDIAVRQKHVVRTGTAKLSGLMPSDAGTLTYTPGSASTTGSVTVSSWSADVNTGEVRYTLSSGAADDTVTLPVTISSANYEDTAVKVVITLTAKDPQQPLTITGADTVVYGRTLKLTATGGSGTGAVTYRIDTAASNGKATIDPVTGVLTPVSVGSVSVIAVKAGDDDYNEITSAPFVLMIQPAAPAGEPKYTRITTGGKTLADAGLTAAGSTLTPSAGQLDWVNDKGKVLPDSTVVEANTAYTWRFTPDDRNYTTLTGTVTLYAVSGGGGGGGGTSYHTIRASAGANGSISPDGNVSVRAGRSQTFTLTPDTGCTVADVLVDGKSVGAVTSYTFEHVSRSHTIEARFRKTGGVPRPGAFEDVAAGSYYEDAVNWAVEKGITGGVGSDLFAPDRPCTRAQIVTFLWRAAGSPVVNYAMDLEDVAEDTYYTEAVRWALSLRITAGTGATAFSPDAACTRAQIVTFLFRYAAANGMDAVTLQELISGYADAASVPGYAVPAMNWALSAGIVQGDGTNLLPNAVCTRAQIVTFLWRAGK